MALATSDLNPPQSKQSKSIHIDVSFKDLKEETNSLLCNAFSKFRSLNNSAEHRILRTNDMIKLFDMIETGSSHVTFIVGPPGSGKTTSLYWLYKQLARLEEYYVLPIPVHSLNEVWEEIQDVVMTVTTGKKLVFVMDIPEPSGIHDECRCLLDKIFVLATCKIVVSVSSCFGLYLNAYMEATTLRGHYLTANRLQTAPFTFEDAKTYVKTQDCDVNEETLKAVLQIANNIPRLLSMFIGKELNEFRERVKEQYMFEFTDVVKYMSKNTTTMWESEAKLLLAAVQQLPYKLFNMSLSEVEELLLVKSFFISINNDNDIPKTYFRLSECKEQYMIKLLWSKAPSNLRTNNVSVIADHFENSVPSVISPKIKWKLRSWNNGSNEEVELLFKGIPLSLAPTNTKLKLDLLYQTSPGFKAIDYVAVKNGLLDEPGDCLIAIQVTAQRTKLKEKMESSICVSEKLTSGKSKVIFLFISLHHTEFEENYEMFKYVTASAAKKKRFENWWYGQPSNFDPILAKYAMLEQMFSNVHI